MAKPAALSSADAPWDCALLELHGPNEVDSLVAIPQDTVFVQLTPAHLEFKVGDGPLRALPVAPGRTFVVPKLAPVAVKTFHSGDLLAVTLQPWIFVSAVEDAPSNGVELIPRVARDDQTLRDLLLALKSEVETSCRGGRLYGESLTMALAGYLLTHHSTGRPPPQPSTRGLSKASLRSVVDYIHADLGKDIALSDLATVAGHSCAHFAREFKRSTGLPPHQFVIRSRVERARELLLRSDLEIAQVAREVGFCDQSHLGHHFKRHYGITPKAFVRKLRRK